MGKVKFSDDFKRDTVHQITERGYPVAEVSRRLGVSPHSLYAWKKKFAKAPGSGDDDQAAEIRRLKREQTRVTEERDILKKATAYFARDAKFARLNLIRKQLLNWTAGSLLKYKRCGRRFHFKATE
jgi:transposase